MARKKKKGRPVYRTGRKLKGGKKNEFMQKEKEKKIRFCNIL